VTLKTPEPTGLHGRPTAAELVAAVADFLDSDVRAATEADKQVNFHVRVAANVLRTVERELLAAGGGNVGAALSRVGCADEKELAAAIRAGRLDDRETEVADALRVLVRHRLDVSHPGYDRQ
jgi:hypothetical protein